MGFLGETIDTGDSLRSMIRTEDCVVMQMENETGEGTMTAYRIFDGAYLMYNDFHMAACVSQFRLADGAELLAIDHCRAGRIESEVKPGVFSYLQEKELRIDNRRYHSGTVSFPMEHYHGITVGLELPTANDSIRRIFQGFSVDLEGIRKKYVNADRPYVLKDDPGIEHLFSELWHVPQGIRKEYCTLKILELLLYLNGLTLSDSYEERPYFYRSQVEKVKRVHELIEEDLRKHYTTEKLAETVNISPTALKSCFREIYGMSLYGCLRSLRLNRAAVLLRTAPEMSVGEIAEAVGYENQGKFSSAFKEMMGMTPMEYKKSGKSV